MIGDYEAHLTAEYHELHSKYGSVSSSFDSNWRYTVAKPVDSSGIVYDPRLYDTTVYASGMRSRRVTHGAWTSCGIASTSHTWPKS